MIGLGLIPYGGRLSERTGLVNQQIQKVAGQSSDRDNSETSCLSTSSLPWVQRFEKLIAWQIDTQHGQKDSKARENRHPPGASNIGPAGIKHSPPFRRRWLGA